MAASVPKRLKVGLILDTSLDQPDGVQQYVLAVGDWLRSKGHDVHYLVGQSSRQDIPNLHSLARNIPVQSNGNRTTIPLPTSRRKLRRFLKAQKFDVLHVQMPHSPFLAQPLIKSAAKTTARIGTFHIVPYSWLENMGTRLLAIWTHSSTRRIDQVVSVSSAAADFAKHTYGLATEVLPNVIDYQRFKRAKPLPQYKDGKLNVLFLGRLVPRKGCQLLLAAVGELQRQPGLPPFRVIICGKGPLEPKLRHYVKQHQLDDVVDFQGFVSEDDKPRYYASADIAVFPSSGGESFGIVLLEAMASGQAAVLAGDNPGYRSVMAPKPELLFSTQSPAALTALLGQYLRDGRKRAAARRWGTAYAKDFDIDNVGRQLLTIYRRALRKRRPQ